LEEGKDENEDFGGKKFFLAEGVGGIWAPECRRLGTLGKLKKQRNNETIIVWGPTKGEIGNGMLGKERRSILSNKGFQGDASQPQR